MHGVRGFAWSFRTAERERVIGERMGSAGVWMVAAGGSVYCFAVGVHARLKKTDFSDGNILYGVWGVSDVKKSSQTHK